MMGPGGSGVVVLAHRGASARRPENTLAAFIEARSLGAHGVELDVRRSRDGAVVVHHDGIVPGVGPIHDLVAAALPPEVPLLAAVLEACGGLVVNVELKDLPGEAAFDPAYPLAALVVDEVARAGRRAAVIISSFDLGALDAVRAVDPSLATAWLTPGGFDQVEALEAAAGRGHRGLHPHHAAVTEALVSAAHDKAMFVTAWTVDDPGRVRALAALGVDGIITNRPDMALAALRKA